MCMTTLESPTSASTGPRARPRRGGLLVALLAGIVVGAVFILARRNPASEHVQAGKNYLRMNNGPAAEQEWKTAVRLDPGCAPAWEALAKYYINADDYAAALEPLSRYARLKPDAPHVFDRLATCASLAHDAKTNLLEAEAALQRDPNDVAALSIAVRALTTLDEEQKRLQYLRRFVALRPNDMDVLILAARTFTTAHLYDEAAPLIERMLKLDPNSADACGLRGRRYLDTGTSPQDFARAEADFRKVLELNPDGPMPHLHLGKLYLRTGKPDQAIEHLEVAANRLPGQPEVFFNLAEAYRQANRPDRADAARKRFAALREQTDQANALEKRCLANPDAFELQRQMGLLALDRGDTEKAEFFLDRAKALRPADAKTVAGIKRLSSLSGEAPAAGGAQP